MDLKEFGLYFAKLRKKSGYRSQRQLSIASGVSNGTIARIESGTQRATPDTLKKLAPHLKDVTYEELLSAAGYINDETQKIIEQQGHGVRMIPVLGVIHAGDPIPAQEQIIEWVPVAESVAKSGNFFALKVIGDCMAGGKKPIEEGDIVIVRQQPTVENGEIAVVLWPDVNEAQLRRVYVRDEHVILRADNPDYAPEIVKHRELRIIGRVVSIMATPAAASEV